jgi:hypothetical protein
VLELFDAADVWHQFEEWKRELAAVVARDGEAHQDTDRVALWDFSGYNRYATEAVPAEGDRSSQMQWYRDPGHFKKELGDVLLSVVLSGQTPDASDSFGTRLQPADVEPHLARIRGERERYRREYPGVKEQLLGLLRGPATKGGS